MSDPISDAIYNAVTTDPGAGFMSPLTPAAQASIRAWCDAIAPQIEAVIPPASTWTLVTAFQNSWVNDSGWRSASYRKEGSRVMLGGIIKSGTIGAAAFTLPSGYRPALGCIMVTPSADAFGEVRVYPDGRVVPYTGSNSWFSLDGLTFYTD